MTDEMIERAGENIKAAGLDNVEARRRIIEKRPIASDSVDSAKFVAMKPAE